MQTDPFLHKNFCSTQESCKVPGHCAPGLFLYRSLLCGCSRVCSNCPVWCDCLWGPKLPPDALRSHKMGCWEPEEQGAGTGRVPSTGPATTEHCHPLGISQHPKTQGSKEGKTQNRARGTCFLCRERRRWPEEGKDGSRRGA